MKNVVTVYFSLFARALLTFTAGQISSVHFHAVAIIIGLAFDITNPGRSFDLDWPH